MNLTSPLPEFSIEELFSSGVHFGHRTSRWNPKMSPYIYGQKNGIHIIDLRATKALLKSAMLLLYKTAKRNGKVLFVGTKPSSSGAIAEYVSMCGQYYVNHRWLGGMLTNWRTVSKSIKRLDELEKLLADPEIHNSYTKKEILRLSRSKDKLLASFCGIRKMKRSPDLVVVLDTIRDSIAVSEANKLGIPVVGIVDTNSDPSQIDHPIPGNDDSANSIATYMQLFSKAIIAGLESNLASEEASASK
jgi:small subunit ribosomal protein S2